jgi:hypothetical protein
MKTDIKVRRRGYSLTVVLLFLVLLLGLWAAVYRTTASFLRVEMARVKRNDADAGVLSAMGQALMYLENNPSRNPVIYGISVPPIPDNPTAPTKFIATFTPVNTPTNGWTVTVAPYTDPTTLTPLPGS